MLTRGSLLRLGELLVGQKHLIFIGHVQGVGFRARVKKIAESCGIQGYVRNLSSGDVEVFAVGENQDIDLFIAAILKAFAHHVKDVKEIKTSNQSIFEDFQILYS